MPLAWLYAQVDPVVAGLVAVLYVFATLVHPLWTFWRIRSGAPVLRHRHWFVASHLVAIFVLITVVPGVDLEHLGLGWQPGRGWPAALGIVAGVVAVIGVVTAWMHRIHKADGQYADHPPADLNGITETFVICARDALLFVAVPLFVAVAAFDVPLAWAVVATMIGYGLHHLWMGVVVGVVWTGFTGVLLIVYLLSGHVVLPTVVLVAAAVIPNYAWPRAPAEPPPTPALTMIEPPAPLR
jgi:hypothetical protein